LTQFHPKIRLPKALLQPTSFHLSHFAKGEGFVFFDTQNECVEVLRPMIGFRQLSSILISLVLARLLAATKAKQHDHQIRRFQVFRVLTCCFDNLVTYIATTLGSLGKRTVVLESIVLKERSVLPINRHRFAQHRYSSSPAIRNNVLFALPGLLFQSN